MGGGGGRALTGCIFCLQVLGPINGVGREGGGLIIRRLLHTVEKLSKLPHRKYAPPSLPSELLMRIGLPTPFFSRNYFLCIFPIVVHC